MLRMEGMNASTQHMQHRKGSATPMNASAHAWGGSVSGASAANLVVEARRTALTRSVRLARARQQFPVFMPMGMSRPRLAMSINALRVMCVRVIAKAKTTKITGNCD